MTEFVWGTLDDFGSSIGRYAVATQEVPWAMVKNRVGKPPVCVSMVDGLDKPELERLVENTPEVDAVVGIGGGVCLDNAKYLAWRRNCAAILIPTIVSVNAFATSNVAMRENGVANHVRTPPAEKVIIDFGVIQNAPKRLNTAGVGDIYSCETALFDWKLANGATGEWYDESIAARTREIVRRLISESDAIRNVTERGIRSLVDLHVETVVVQELAKSSRPESGSEHVYFFSLEHTTGRSFLHGEAVGTGIYVLRHFQAGDEEESARTMDELGLLFRPEEQGVGKEEFISAVLHMKEYASYETYRKKLPYSILDTAKIGRDDAESLWKALA